MTDVVVERVYPEGASDDALMRNFRQSLFCLDLHRVQWRRSYLSADRRELVCHFAARDAESVRLALRQSEVLRQGRVWAATVHDEPGATDDGLLQAGVLACRAARPADRFDLPEPVGQCLLTHRVTPVRSYLSSDRRRLVGLYRAPDAESVRLALRDAGAELERVWVCRHLHP